MIGQAAADLDLDLARSFMIGDKITDVELIHRVGGRGVFVLTGYGKGDLENFGAQWRDRPDFIAAHVEDAVDWILAGLRLTHEFREV